MGNYKKKVNKKKPKQSFSHVDHTAAADFFHLGIRALYKWVEAGCPRNIDKTYDLFKVHEWLLKEATKGDTEKLKLKDQKLTEEIQKLKITNLKLSEKYIDRKEHENILTSRAISLRNFFERGLAMNRAQRSMRSVDELASLDYEFTRGMMEAYLGKTITTDISIPPQAEHPQVEQMKLF
jgi:hypothetical protein